MSAKNSVETEVLLKKWEEVYKKGLLSFWLLLFLHERSAYAYELGTAASDISHGTVSADENSIYRALNRFESLGIVTSEMRQSDIGPQRRYYRLTEIGRRLLTQFTQRNILVFQTPSVTRRIQAVIDSTSSGEADNDFRNS